jgi:hypothetical protein
MAVANSVKIRYELLRILPFASILQGGVFTGVGLPFQDPPRMIKVQNTTDQGLYISFNGYAGSAVDFIVAESGFIYDYGSNRSDTGGNLEQPAGDRVYVYSDVAPTIGNVYVTVMYASND